MIYRWADFELDTENCELRHGSTPLHVEPQVFDVLAYLVSNHGRLVTKDELIDRVWGNRFVSESALTSRVKLARRLLGDDGVRQDAIKTVHGRGYRFVAPVAASTPTSDPHTSDASNTGGAPRPLTGRGDELAFLRRLYGEAARGEPRIAFVCGPAGIGKTMLIESFRKELSSAKMARCCVGNCIPQRGTGEAYLPVLDALGDLGRSGHADMLAAALAERAPTWLNELRWLASPEQLAAASQRTDGSAAARMLRELLDVLEILSAERPLVMVLEDLHWSDPSTLDLIDGIARRRSAASVLVVGTYRPAQSVDQSTGVHAMARELAAAGRCASIWLRPLADGSIAEIVQQRFGGTTPPVSLISVLMERTGGVPLFVHELLETWVAEGLLVPNAPSPPPLDIDLLRGHLPDSTRECIEQSVDRLAPFYVDVLEAASVVGPTFSAAAVAAGCGRSVLEVERLCGELLRGGMVAGPTGEEVWPDRTVSTTYGFVHDLYREVLYERLPSARRSVVHAAIAQRLEQAYGSEAPGVAATLARHFAGARDPMRALDYSVHAAENQLRHGAHREADQHLQTARTLLDQLPASSARDQQELRLLVRMGNAAISAYGYAAPQATAIYRQANQLAARLGEGPHVMPVLYGLWNTAVVGGAHRPARDLGESFLRLASVHDPVATLVAHRAVAWPALLMGDLATARMHLEPIVGHDIELPEASWAPYGEHPVIAGRGTAAWVAWLQGHGEEALNQSAEAVSLARQLGHPFTLAYALTVDVVLRQWEDDVEATMAGAMAALDNATTHDFALFVAWALVEQGWAQVRHGDETEGLKNISTGLDACASVGAQVFGTYFLGVQADALAAVGRHGDALDAIERGLDSGRRMEERFVESDLLRRQAELLAACGDHARAAEAQRAALATARELGQPHFTMLASKPLDQRSRHRRGR